VVHGIGIGIAPALIWEMSQFWDEMSQFWDEMSQFWDEMSQFWGNVASAAPGGGGSNIWEGGLAPPRLPTRERVPFPSFWPTYRA
jgi:hypothetical protein